MNNNINSDDHVININSRVDTLHNDTLCEDPKRSKFKSIYETNSDETNSDENNSDGINSGKKKKIINSNTINTETINTENSDEYKLSKNNYDSSREFSVTTLDRKLKQIRNKRINYKSIRSIVQKNDESSEKEFMIKSSRLDMVMIKMNPSKLINEHLSEIQIRIIGHNRASVLYNKLDKIIGYPVTIISSFLSSTIMMTIISDNEYSMSIIKYISLILSLTSFIFSISRDYLNYSHKVKSHELSSKLYTTLLRSIEVRLIKEHLPDDEKRDIFKDIVDQMSIIEQYENPVPDSINSKLMDEHNLMMN
jgi:hypothetical protein